MIRFHQMRADYESFPCAERPASVVLQSWINRALARVKDLRKENAQLKKELNDTIAKELKKRASASTPQISATHAKEFLEKDFRCGYLYKEHEESAELLEPFVPNPEVRLVYHSISTC